MAAAQWVIIIVSVAGLVIMGAWAIAYDYYNGRK